MSLIYQLKKIALDWNRLVIEELYKRGIVMPPKLVAWDSTRRCNLDCRHCGAKRETYSRELTTEEMKKIIDEIVAYGVHYFGATGGEPLLRSDLFEIFGYAKQKGLSTTLASNGFFVSDNNVEKIVEIIDSVQISLDGNEDIHNQIRGNNLAFGRATKAMKLLKQNGIRQLTVSTVITSFNIYIFEDLAKIVEEIKPSIWKIILVMSIGKAEENQSLILDKKQFTELMDKIFKLKKKWKKKIKIDLGENSTYLGKYESKIRETPFFCPVGFNACCIGVDGNVRGCPEQPDIQYFREGNILEKNLREIWTNGFKKYRTKNYLQDPVCGKCSFNKKCRGGCWVCKNKGQQCPVQAYQL